jgi:hypothetical protein
MRLSLTGLLCRPDVRFHGRVYQPIIKNGQPLENSHSDYQEAVNIIQGQCQLIE